MRIVHFMSYSRYIILKDMNMTGLKQNVQLAESNDKNLWAINCLYQFYMNLLL